MAETKITTSYLDIETLNEIAARLAERADAINQLSLAELVADLRIAASACRRLSELKFRIGEIAATVLEHNDWDSAAIARDLRELLETGEDDA